MYVFGYSTLKSREIREKILGRPSDAVADILEGYVKKHVLDEKGSSYPTLERYDGAGIIGSRFEVSGVEELEKIDKWESKYQRKPVRLRSGEKAWVYTLKSGGK